MKENKSEWDAFINVELFFKNFVDKKFTDLFLQHKTLREMIQASDIKQVITYAYILRWPGYTDTSLANLMSFEKNIVNDINICLLSTPLYHYSQDEDKAILMDIDTNELAGIQLVTAAIAGDIATLSLINPAFVKSFYLFFALRTAVRFGHDKCLLHLLQFIKLVHISEDQSTLFLHEASRFGYVEIVKILLQKWQFVDAKSATLEIFHALPTAARRGHKEIVEVFLKQTKYKISSRGLQLAIHYALQRDDKEIIELLFEYVRMQKNTSKLLTSMHPHNIDGILGHSPRKCIVPIMQTFLGVSNTTYQSIFTGISRAGDVACAEEFTKFCQQDRSRSEEATNVLLMDCMLQGFLPAIVDEDVIVDSCIHYPMIYYQIDTFLMLSAKCNLVLNKDDMPHQSDVERLLNALFAGPCEIGIYYLMNHEILKRNPQLYYFCSQRAMNHVIKHGAISFLRILLQAGVTVELTLEQDDIRVNNQFSLKNINSHGVQCVLWLTRAITELQQASPNEQHILYCLRAAKSFPCFDREWLLLIYNNFIPVNLQTLRRLAAFLEGSDFEKAKNMIDERISILHSAQLNASNQLITSIDKLVLNTSSAAIIDTNKIESKIVSSVEPNDLFINEAELRVTPSY